MDSRFLESIKYLVEQTDLFIQVSGIDPNIVSDWGRATSVNLETGIVKWDKAAVVYRRLGGECSALANYGVRLELHISRLKFEMIRNYCKDDGSWQYYEMDNFKGNSWEELHEYIIQLLHSRRPMVRFRKWLAGFFKPNPQSVRGY